MDFGLHWVQELNGTICQPCQWLGSRNGDASWPLGESTTVIQTEMSQQLLDRLLLNLLRHNVPLRMNYNRFGDPLTFCLAPFLDANVNI